MSWRNQENTPPKHSPLCFVCRRAHHPKQQGHRREHQHRPLQPERTHQQHDPHTRYVATFSKTPPVLLVLPGSPCFLDELCELCHTTEGSICGGPSQYVWRGTRNHDLPAIHQSVRGVIGVDSGDTVTADEVIVAVGIKPNTELAQLAHLEIDTKLVRTGSCTHRACPALPPQHLRKAFFLAVPVGFGRTANQSRTSTEAALAKAHVVLPGRCTCRARTRLGCRVGLLSTRSSKPGQMCG